MIKNKPTFANTDCILIDFYYIAIFYAKMKKINLEIIYL